MHSKHSPQNETAAHKKAGIGGEACVVPIAFSEAGSTQGYDIVIGAGVLSSAGDMIRKRLGTRRCIIVTDSNVGPLYLQRLEALLTASGHACLPAMAIPAGEASKSYAELQAVLNHMLLNGADRKTLVIALGGGVVGDLAGLSASLALRGLDIVQVPTSLLAQVDSSVGGKTGIDTLAGKNTVGTFNQPKLVVADVTLLDSLPPREMRAGYAEVIKYGVIQDKEFFGWCCSHGARLLQGDRPAQIHAVEQSCRYKAAIVAADEHEQGIRALLNMGHTFGHALEAVIGYDNNRLIHGEAVSIGMIMAMKLSARLKLCAPQDADQLGNHLQEVGLPILPPASNSVSVDRLIEMMAMDKKAQAGKLTLVLARGIGQAFVQQGVDAQSVRSIWEETLSESGRR
ncbi:MAG: 3-dehydroquinate synthase [Bdellovibrionales bacterium]